MHESMECVVDVGWNRCAGVISGCKLREREFNFWQGQCVSVFHCLRTLMSTQPFVVAVRLCADYISIYYHV